jgi:hypothetical protein
MSNSWDIVLLMASTFLFVAYLVVLFHVVIDLFRDPEVGGGTKVLWIIGPDFSTPSYGPRIHPGPRPRHGAAAARCRAPRQS